MPRITPILVAFAVAFGLAGCEKHDVAEKSTASTERVRDEPDGEKASGGDGPSDERAAGKEGESGSEAVAERESPSLAEALEPPEDAVTSEGRFRELQNKGLRDYTPEIGVLYAAAGVEQPAVRIVVTPDGRVKWDRGKGMYWEKLGETGSFELSGDRLERLSELVETSWTIEPEYPPSDVRGTRVVIIRHRDTVRLFEYSALPEHLEGIDDLLMPNEEPSPAK